MSYEYDNTSEFSMCVAVEKRHVMYLPLITK